MKYSMQKRPSLLLLHLSFAIILVGACITHFWGEQGIIHLRMNRPVHAMQLDDNGFEKLPFEISLTHFEVINYPDTDIPMDYVSTISTGEQELCISMNHIGEIEGYRLYQSSYDSDLRGSILAVNHDPWGIGVTYVGYTLLFISLLLLLFMPHEGFRNTLRVMSPKQQRIGRTITYTIATLFLLLLSYILYRWCMRGYDDGYLPPVLRSPLLLVHVSVIMFSYVLFAILFVNGLVALGVMFFKNDNTHLELFLYHISRLLLYPAVYFLAAGIFIGAIWANLSWGRYWGWDPKETWALITMLIYGFAFHRVTFSWFNKHKFFHIYMVMAFLSVLMTYFGVNYLLGGMHSYAN